MQAAAGTWAERPSVRRGHSLQRCGPALLELREDHDADNDDDGETSEYDDESHRPTVPKPEGRVDNNVRFCDALAPGSCRAVKAQRRGIDGHEVVLGLLGCVAGWQLGAGRCADVMDRTGCVS